MPLSAVITGSPNMFFYEAETDICVRAAPTEEVYAFIKSNSEISFSMLHRQHLSNERMMVKINHLMSGNAKSRVVFEILNECRRFGHTSDEDSSIHLQLNEKDLAARAGLSRETVNREIQKLKEQNFIDTRRNTIIIHNILELETIIEKAL